MYRSIRSVYFFASIIVLSLVTAFGANAATINLAGPVYPPPCGVSMSQNGTSGDNLIGKAGGKTWTFNNTVLADKTQVYWGAEATGIRLSFNSQNQTGAEIMTYSAADSDFASGKVVWTGQTYLPGYSGNPFTTRFTMHFMNSDDTPLAVSDATSLGLAANVGAVVPVGSSSLQYKVNILFEAFAPYAGSYQPSLDVYDYYHINWQLPPGSTAWSDYTAGFYYVNSSPSISDIQNALVQQDGTTSIPFTVNDNESDPAIDPSGLTVSATTSNGALVPLSSIVFGGSAGNRTVGITPNAGMSGTSTITITVADGTYPGAQSTSDSFVLTVNAPPHLSSNTLLTVNQGNSATITSSNLNSSDAESGPTSRTFTVGYNGNGGPPRNGTLKRNGLALATGSTFTQQDVNDGLITYTHSDNCATTDDFQFNISDSNGGVAPTGVYTVYTFGISILQPNRPPVAQNANAAVSLGRPYNGTLTATDPDCTAQTLTYSIASDPSKGNVVLTNDKTGAFTYTPNEGQSGADSFTFQVNDGMTNATLAGVVTINIANQAPVSNNASATIKEGATLSGTLSATDFDLPAQPLTFSIATNGTKGTAVITDAATGAFTYTPRAENIGSDSFSFTTSDGLLTSAPATFTVAIRPVLAPGNIIVSNGKINGVTTALVLLDPLNSQQAVISSGDKFTDLNGVAVEADGSILVIDSANGLLRVNPDDGSQSVVSTGPFGKAIGVAVEADGNILVGSMLGLLRIDPISGATLTTFSGNNLDFPAGVTVAPDGQIFVTDVGAFAGKPSQIIKIDPLSGAQQVITTGNLLAVPADLVLDSDGMIFVADGPMGTNNVIQVNPTSGEQTLVSTGTNISLPAAIKILGGNLVTANGGNASVVTVNALSGEQGVLYSGSLLTKPFGLAVVNHPPTISAINTIFTKQDTVAGPVNFTIGDIETSLANLTVKGVSSNQGLVPDANIVLGGGGADRTASITPAAGLEGVATITLTVGDGLAKTSRSFDIVVDGTPPVGSIVINSGALLTNNTTLNLHLEATENNAVSAYFVSQNATTPAGADSGWTTITPVSSFSKDIAFVIAAGDGLKNVYTWYKDLAGNISARAGASITLDTTGPSFSGFAPVDGFWSSRADIALNGSVTDAIAGVSSLTVNGTPVAISGNSFSKPVTLTPGSNAFVLVASDVLGNQSRTEISYNLDNILPNLVVSTLPDGSYTSDATLNVSGNASDADGIQAVLVGADTVPTTPQGNFSSSVTLVNGENLVEVTAIDNAGNQARETRKIILDPAVPTLIITSPTDNLQTTQGSVDITGSADSGATVAISDDTGNPVTVNRAAGDFSATASLRYGLNTITITATNPLSGATQSAKRTIFYDFRKPGLAVTSPDRDVTITNGEIELKGLVSDALSDVTVTVSAAGNNYTPEIVKNGGFSQPLTLTKEGIYPIVVSATDLDGNTAMVQRNVQFTRGSIVINRGASTTTGTSVTVNLAYLPAAPATTTSKMLLLFNGKAWSKPIPFVEQMNVLLPKGDGVKTVSVEYVDDSGATSAFYSDTIILDTKVPQGSITINNGALATTSPNVMLNMAVSDVNGVVKMQFSDNGTTWSNPEPFAPKRAYILPGTYGLKKVYVQFKDSSGKLSKSYFDAINYVAQAVDDGNPGNIAINGSVPFTTSTTVTLTAPEGPLYIRLSNDGNQWGSWLSLTSPMSWKLPGGDGLKTVYAQYSDDKITTSSVYSASITLDTIAPSGWLLINNGAAVTNTATVNLTMGASDLNGVAGMCIKETTATCSDGDFVPYSASRANYPIQSPGDGIKNIYISYRDNAGKVSKPIKASIALDTTAPIGKVVINGGKATTATASVILKLSASKAVYMQISVDNGSSWREWEPYVKIKNVNLPNGAGEKTVKVRFRDLVGNTSAECVDTITLQ